MKIRPLGAELFHADGRTDTTNVVVASRSFVNAPKMEQKIRVFSSFLLGTVRDTSTDFLSKVSFKFCTINCNFFKLFYISFYRPIFELFRQEVFIKAYVKKHRCRL